MSDALKRLCRRLVPGLGAAGSVVVAAAMIPSAALAEPVPSEFWGTWSRDCADPATTQIVVERSSLEVVSGGRRHAYAGVEVSRTWYGGARATGDRVWLLISKGPNQPYDFVVELAAGSLVMEEGHPDHGREVKRLFGPKFLRCAGGTAQDARTEASPRETGNPARANDLDVPVVEQGGDGQAANCMSSVVAGLKAGGDGFLAVRSGPGTSYRKIDELHNGDEVIIFEVRGKWAGVVYRTPDVACASTTTRPVAYDRKGWVHMNWLKDVAG